MSWDGSSHEYIIKQITVTAYLVSRLWKAAPASQLIVSDLYRG